MKNSSVFLVLGIVAALAIAPSKIAAEDSNGEVNSNTFSPDTSATSDEVMLTVNGLETKEEG